MSLKEATPVAAFGLNPRQSATGVASYKDKNRGDAKGDSPIFVASCHKNRDSPQESRTKHDFSPKNRPVPNQLANA